MPVMLHTRISKYFLTTSFLIFSSYLLFSQMVSNVEELRKFSNFKNQLYKIEQETLIRIAAQKKWSLQKRTPEGNIAYLTGIDERGLPEYLITTSNLNAAATIGTNQLWVGGDLGLSLDGSTASLSNKLAIWDEGKVRETHLELGTNRIIFADNATTVSSHSTHVAGTLIGKGINPLAKGMSFNAQNLLVYSFSNDLSEMSAAASNLLLKLYTKRF